MNKRKILGNSDKPIESWENDEFQIEPYIAGLAEFIEECETPITIAIQGEWGCGKTSMMNMVRNYLKQKRDVVDVWFNTWQFSQFNMDEQLSVNFLKHLVKELSKSLSDIEGKRKIYEKLNPIMKSLTVGMTKQFIGEEIGGMISEIISEEKLDMADEVFELKRAFQELIQKVTGHANKRVVIFIDDLDRLQPVRAVELLEVLKLFIDCENCVFVMAIDTSVVFQGIREKYGNDMSKEKAQSFFDKMIQLPFKMPVAYYKLDSMLERLLDFLQNDNLDEKERRKYIELFRKTTNGNPRTIKRLVNSIMLLDKVAIKKNIYSNEDVYEKEIIRKIFVILSCIQLKYENTYDFIVNNISYETIESICNLDTTTRNPRKEEKDKELKKVQDIGLIEATIQDRYVFYDLIITLAKEEQKFVNALNGKLDGKREAIKRLVKIISLNNVVDNSLENQLFEYESNLEVKEQMKTDTDTMLEKKNYFEMINSGKAMEVYRELEEQKIYPRINENMRCSNEKNSELNSYRNQLIRPEDFFLFNKFNTEIEEYYIRASSRIEETYCMYRYDNEGRSQDDNVYFYLDFYPRDKVMCLKLQNSLAILGLERYKRFIADIRQDYQELQEKYGKEIFPDKEIEKIEEKTDAEGEIKEIRGEIYFFSNKTMNIIIDFLTEIARGRAK